MRNTRSKRQADRWLREIAAFDQEECNNREQLDQMQQKLRKACQLELTSRQREIVELYFFSGEEVSISAIARQLGIHRSTASRTLQRALARLHSHLRYGW